MLGPVTAVATALVLWISSVTVALAQISFESRQSHRQVVHLMGAREIVLESSLLDTDVVVQRGDTAEVILIIAGRYSIAGFHGSRARANARDLTGPELAFTVSRAPNTLILSSPEWTYIHHSLLIERLTITLPESISLKFSRVMSLEGRQ